MSNESATRMLNRLVAGADRYRCGGYLASLPKLRRLEFYNTLLFERLQRKIDNLDTLRDEAGENWNQAFYLLYFRTLGDRSNQAAYLELARRVPYKIVLRERRAANAVEAMLLGCSGLLDLYRDDTYTLDLKRTYTYLSAKYNLEPMLPEQWQLSEIRPANHPVLRLAQAAEFFRQDEFLMERTLACCNADDVKELFCIDSSEYWRTHFVPGITGNDSPKRLGILKAHLIGINLVAIIQFAYGSYTANEVLRNRALSLLETLPAEDNRYIRNWQNEGIAPENAFDTQALLQLATEYCARKRCADCPVGRELIKSVTEDC